MTLFLKQSTAVVISFGPALDKTDGVTEETGLVSALDHATTGIKLSKNGGALTIRHATVTATTYDAYGMYRVTLDTTDTNTLGTLRMAFNEAATCLPVWQDFMVLPANIYDSIVSGSDLIDVSMTQILGTAVSSPATAGILDVNVKNIDNDAASASGTVTFPNATLASTTNITAASGIAVSSIGANVITAASIAADAITDAKVASDVTIASVTGAVGSVTGAVGSVTGAVGSVTGNVGGNVVGSVGSVVGHTPQTGDSYARLGAPAGASVSADIAAIQAKTVNLPAAPASTTNITAAAGVTLTPTTGLGNQTADITGTITTVTTATNLTNLPATAALEATLTAMKGATFAGATDSLEAIRDRGDAAWATATGFSTLDAAGVRTAIGMASANLDTQLTAIDDAVDTEVAAIYSRLGAPAGASMSADIAAVKAETALIQAKTTNLPAAPASTTNITQATGIDITKILGTAISTPATAGMLDVNIVNIGGSAADLGATPGMLDVRLAEVSLGGGTQLRANLGLATADLDTQLAALPTAAEIADANWDEAMSGHLAAGTTGKALSDAGAAGTPLDAAGVRAAVGLASANLDTQLTAIDDLIDTEVAAIKTVVDGIDTKMGMPNITLADDIGAPVVSLGADVQAVKVVVDTIAGYLDTEIAAIKAKTDNLPASPSSLDAAGVRTAIGMASANLDTQLGNTYNRIGAPVFGNISGDIAANYAILTNIEDSVGIGVSADVAAIYNRIGAPAGASVSADIAAVKAVDDAVKVKTDYLPSATAGAAGGVFIAGSNAATSITTALTANVIGNVTGNLSGSVGSVTGAVGSVTGAVGSVTGAVGSVAANGITATSIATDAINAAAVKADAVTKIQTGLATPTNITAAAGIALSAGERTTLANAILDVADGATTNYTLREALEVMLAVLAGKLSGAATATITIRDVNDTKNVVVATTDASGNRTAVTVTP